MSLYDFRSVVETAIEARGGKTDPAAYVAINPSTVTTRAQISFKPEGARGPFLAFGLVANRTTVIEPSRLSIVVGETRLITESPTMRNSIAHDATLPDLSGIVLSRWPAPLFVGSGKSVTQSETLAQAAGTLASTSYMLAGFHTDQDSAEWARRFFGEVRFFGFDVNPVFATQAGNATGRFTTTEALDLIEYNALSIDSTGALDFIRATLEGRQLFQADRTAGTLSAILPTRLGLPSSYLGRRAEAGHTLIVQERVASAQRIDAFSVLAIQGRADT